MCALAGMAHFETARFCSPYSGTNSGQLAFPGGLCDVFPVSCSDAVPRARLVFRCEIAAAAPRSQQIGIGPAAGVAPNRHPLACHMQKAATGGLHLAGRPEGGNTMQDFKRGTVRANQLTFEYLTAGDGPLALCVHGFPDSPFSYRYLLPALAEAGYRAVAPFNRGFAPTELPADRHHIHSSTMVADQIALHEALGGGADAILVAHDWGAVAAWGAAGKEAD